MSALQPSEWPCQLPCLAERLWQIEALDRRSDALDRRSGALDRRSEALDRRSETPGRRSGAQAAQRGFLGAHKGVPRATKAAQRAPRGGQRARPRDLGRGKIDPKSASEAKKVKFAKSAPRLGPADVPGTPPPSRLTPNRPKMVPSRSLGPLERSKLHLAQANLALYGPLWPNLASKSPGIAAQQSISEHLRFLGSPQFLGARGLLAEH